MRSGVSTRYCKSNNKYLKYLDPKQESKNVMYLATKNCYGYAMSKFLPTWGLKSHVGRNLDIEKYKPKRVWLE